MKETGNIFMSELTEVFSKRRQQFIQFAYSYVRDKEEAEDIVMGAFTNVWEHRNELREDTNISALLLTAIKNRSLNHLQHLEVRMRAEQHIGVYFEPDEKFTEQGNCFAIGYFCKDCGISYHPVVETVAGAAERLSVSLEFFVKKKPYLSCLGMAFFFISYTGIRNYNLHLNRILC